jgi:16S rRNA (cytosine967-C5)-methyltransferase
MERDSSRADAAKDGAGLQAGEETHEILRLGLGRARGVAAALFDEVQRTATEGGWGRAAEVLSRRLREARSLHSAERRVVSDALHQMVRGLRRLRALSGLKRPTGDQLYLTWLLDRDAPAEPALAAAHQAGLVTADLAARRQALSLPVPPERLGEALSYPEWLVRSVVAEYGAEAPALLAAQNSRAPLTVRVNLGRITREALRERLAAEGIASTPTALSPWGLVLQTRRNVYALPAFQEGLMELQDEGSQLVAELVAPPPGGVVVDACAGAGGKTLALGSLLRNRGRILALDIDERKLQELRRRARRAGLTNVQARVLPGGQVPPDLVPGGASRVLVDAPCSGLGVLRRNPEARWRLKEQDVAELGLLQRQILAACAPLVAPHGRLIYATCTILRAENDAVIDDFLARHPDFAEVPVKEILGCERALQVGDGRRLRLVPRRAEGPDGFFAAVLRRREVTP